MFAFLYDKTNSKAIVEKKSFPSFFQKNANVSIFIEIQIILEKMCCYLHFSLWIPIALAKIYFLYGPNLAQKSFYLAGTVLKILCLC